MSLPHVTHVTQAELCGSGDLDAVVESNDAPVADQMRRLFKAPSNLVKPPFNENLQFLPRKEYQQVTIRTIIRSTGALYTSHCYP